MKTIIGCIFALCKMAGSKKEIYINEMAVLPERQGQGIGRQLLHAILDYNKEDGLAEVVLYTSEYAPAAKFYEKKVLNCRKELFVCIVNKVHILR